MPQSPVTPCHSRLTMPSERHEHSSSFQGTILPPGEPQGHCWLPGFFFEIHKCSERVTALCWEVYKLPFRPRGLPQPSGWLCRCPPPCSATVGMAVLTLQSPPATVGGSHSQVPDLLFGLRWSRVKHSQNPQGAGPTQPSLTPPTLQCARTPTS